MKLSLLAAVSAVVAMTGAAQAAQVAALVAPDTIAMVDTDAKRVTGTWKLTGLPGALVGIDVRPADGMLYGLTADGSVVTIDKTGKVAVKSKWPHRRRLGGDDRQDRQGGREIKA